MLGKKKVRRAKVLEVVQQLPSGTIICMEACGGAHHWAREFEKAGYESKPIAPKFVKPYLKSNKNDYADSEAIMEAGLRPTMRFVGVKQLSQQDMQSLHRVRQRTVVLRTALSNEIRGLLLEYGVIIPQGISQIRSRLAEIIEQHESSLTTTIIKLIRELGDDFRQADKRVADFDKQIRAVHTSSPASKRIGKIGGVGFLTSTAVISYVGNPRVFKRGRDFSAYFGLVPKQNSTGGKAKLGRISKRGESYIRSLLIHGARAELYAARNKTDKRSLWLQQLQRRVGHNKACVALANKNARIIWALLVDDDAQYDREYDSKKAA